MSSFTVTNTKHCTALTTCNKINVSVHLTPRTDIGCMQRQQSLAQYDRAQIHHNLRFADYKNTQASATQHLGIIKALIAEGYRHRSQSRLLNSKDERVAFEHHALVLLSDCFGGVEEQDQTRDSYPDALHRVRRWGLFSNHQAA